MKDTLLERLLIKLSFTKSICKTKISDSYLQEGQKNAKAQRSACEREREAKAQKNFLNYGSERVRPDLETRSISDLNDLCYVSMNFFNNFFVEF